MATTPKWYCHHKSQSHYDEKFQELLKLSQNLRSLTKRLVIDVKVDIFTENNTLLDDCDEILNLYWSLKDNAKNEEYEALTKKSKRNPYNALLLYKYNSIMELNERLFCQLICTLKQTLIFLLRKSLQSDVWLNWALQVTELYNKYCKSPSDSRNAAPGNDKDECNHLNVCDETINANICRNMYPALLLPSKSIDFTFVLQLITQQRLEQNSLDLLFGIFNWNDLDTLDDKNDSNCSSMEILRLLTLNLNTDTAAGGGSDGVRGVAVADFYEDPVRALCLAPIVNPNYLNNTNGPNRLRNKHIQLFLQSERSFVAQLTEKAYDLCPSIFGYANSEDLHEFVLQGIRLMWSHMGISLDHIVLWWIDIPISCYTLTYIESLCTWLCNQNSKDIPEPLYSTLKGLADTLTSFVSNNLWDRLFRYTLISGSCGEGIIEEFLKNSKAASNDFNKLGTATGTIWALIFNNLINFSNSYFASNDIGNSSLLPVAEQIPMLHRIDHTIHCFRLWVKEQSKRLCSEWRMDRYFQIHEHDIQLCLSIFKGFQLPKLTADLSDILMLVCVALRTKLICEIHINLDKLKKTTDECIQIQSDVCRLLSLANFTLCFPTGNYWQKTSYPNNEKSDYVSFVLDQIYLPCIRATKDVNILKLILKLICEAWLDFIYQRQIHFSVDGAVRLLHDFDQVREWILNCPLLADYEDILKLLSNHEVLRTCKGVGKILLRKPDDIISITHSPKFTDRKMEDASAASVAAGTETQLPSEMFVSNQKHWLRLRASKSTVKFLPFCCNDINI